MRIPEEHIDLFEAYLNGSLLEKDVLEFDARLAYDVDFKEQFESYKLIEIGIRQHHRNQMKTKFAEVDKQLDGRSKGKIRSLRWWLISGAAASLILVISVVYLNQCNTSDENKNSALVAEFWTHEEGLPVKMSNKGRYDDAMNAYKMQKWTVSKELLLKIDSDTSNYFLGIISYQQQDYQQAISRFKKVDNESVYYREAQFRLGLVLLTKEDILLAKKIFQEQIDLQTEFSDSSNDILEKIK